MSDHTFQALLSITLALWILFWQWYIDKRKQARLNHTGTSSSVKKNRIMAWGLVVFSVLLYTRLLLIPLIYYWECYIVARDAAVAGVSAEDFTIYSARRDFSVEDGDFNQATQTFTPAAKQRFLSQFGGANKFGYDTWSALVRYGRQIAPATATKRLSDDQYAKLAIDRFGGRDQEYIGKIEAFIESQPRPPVASYPLERFTDFQMLMPMPIYGNRQWLAYGLPHYACELHIFFPNDDMAFLNFGYGWITPRHYSLHIETDPWDMICLTLVWGFFLQRGMRLITVNLLGRVLRIEKKDSFCAYYRSVHNPFRTLSTVAVVVCLSFWITGADLEPFHILYLQEPGVLLAIVFWNAMMGGVLIESLGNVITLFLISRDVNPLKITWDNVLVAILGVALLWYFQNSWISITAGLLIGSMTSVLHKLVGSRRAGSHRPI